MGGVIGLDFGAVMTVAAARKADIEMTAELLPELDDAITKAWRPDEE